MSGDGEAMLKKRKRSKKEVGQTQKEHDQPIWKLK
jgi:hypothetical protein